MNHFVATSTRRLSVAVTLIASICLHAQPAALAAPAEDQEPEGKIVVLDPVAAAEDTNEELKASETRVAEAPVYWIGVRGRSIESAVLRTHLQLAEDMGVVIEEVLPDSPADRAGLRKHDIILRCNGDAVDNMRVLQQQVAADHDKPLELKIIRLGKPEELTVVPEVRPEHMAAASPPAAQFNGDLNLQGDVMQQLMEQFGARNIGPGVMLRGNGQMLDLNQFPNGVSVAIEREGDGPVQVIVKQGDKTWKIKGDDAEALQQLPDDVRPFVERILRGQQDAQGFGDGFNLRDLEAELQGFVPRGRGDFDRPPMRGNFEGDDTAREDTTKKRIDRLEQKLQDLMRRLEETPTEK